MLLNQNRPPNIHHTLSTYIHHPLKFILFLFFLNYLVIFIKLLRLIYNL
jgi:hypothetical protein